MLLRSMLHVDDGFQRPPMSTTGTSGGMHKLGAFSLKNDGLLEWLGSNSKFALCSTMCRAVK